METEAEIGCLFTEMKQSSRADGLIALMDYRNAKAPLMPSPSHGINWNFQLEIEIYAAR